jgi:hypothetical protein
VFNRYGLPGHTRAVKKPRDLKKKSYCIQRYISYFSMQSLPELRHLYWGIRFYMPQSKKSGSCDLSHFLYWKTLKEMRRTI